MSQIVSYPLFTFLEKGNCLLQRQLKKIFRVLSLENFTQYCIFAYPSQSLFLPIIVPRGSRSSFIILGPCWDRLTYDSWVVNVQFKNLADIALILNYILKQQFIWLAQITHIYIYIETLNKQFEALYNFVNQQMTFFSSLLFLANEILTFYLPIFFTFKFLSSQDHQKIARILKFWCILTFAYVIQFVLSYLLADNLDIIVDFALHIVLIYDEFKYSQQIYDTLIHPLYKNNQDTINQITKKLESYFDKTKEEMKSRVGQSAADKFKGFIGDILVGTLNPANRMQQSRREEPIEQDEQQKDQ